MGRNYNLPPEHAAALKQVFEEDARTITRVLAGCSFEWKAGTIDTIKSTFKTYKNTVINQVKGAAVADEAETAKNQPPVPPQSAKPGATGGWNAATRPGTSPGAKPGMNIGGHRGPTPPPLPPRPQGWQAATPSSAGGKTTIGSHRVPASLIAKLNAMKDSMSRTALVDVTALASEGVSVAIAEAQTAIGDAIKEAAGISLEEIFAEIASEAVAEVVFEVVAAIPFVGAALGIAKNFSSSAGSMFTAGMKQLSIRTINQNSIYVTPGNPRDALEGIKTLLARKRDRALFRAGTEAAHGAARSVGLAADIGAMGATGGAVSSAIGIAGGLVKCAVNLAEAIVRALQDVREMVVGNKLLMFPGQIKVSELVNDCPLLCCYVITEGSPSALIGFLSEGTLGHNWMSEVEELLPKIQEVQRIANVCEREATYVLKATRRNFGDTTGGALKSHSFMSERMRDIPAQVMHDVTRKLKKDPMGLPHTTRMWFEKIKGVLG